MRIQNRLKSDEWESYNISKFMIDTESTMFPNKKDKTIM